MRQTDESHAILSTRYTIRIQLIQAKGINNEKILKKIKKIISRTAAIRVLYSGDIDIIISNKAFKNRARGLLLTKKLKIFKKDYLIKISNILLSVRVACEKEANNTHLITIICEISRIIFLGL
jgi:hypothetical protein